MHTPPTVTAGFTTNFGIGGPAARLDGTLEVNDPDSGGNLASAKISIGSGFVAGDVLNFTNQHSITGSYNSGTGVLQLSGIDTIADYQAALDSITFTTSVGTPGTRSIKWSATDGSTSNGSSADAFSTLDVVSATVITAVTATTVGNVTDLNAGKVVTITVKFGGPVNVTGTPELQLNDGEVATFVGGSGTTDLTFHYTVQPNDNTADLQVQGLLLQGGRIVDGSARDVSLTNANAGLHLQVDTTVPTVTSLDLAGASLNNANSETFTLTFSESVTGVDSSDFAVLTTGIALTGITVTPVSGSVYTVTVNGVTGDGTLGLNLNASGTGIADLAGNALSGGFTGGVYSVDHTPPFVEPIELVSANPNNASSEFFTVNFTEAVTGVDFSDFTVSGSGTAHTGIEVIPQSASSYMVIVTGVTGDGTLGINVNASGSGIADLAGNAFNFDASSQLLVVDHTGPHVNSISRASGSPNNASSETFTVTFSEGVTGVFSSDFTVVTSGTADTGITLTHVGNSNVCTVTVNGVTGDGTLGLNLKASGTGITDLVGNAISGGFTGAVYTIDHIAPTVAVSANSTALLAGQTATVTFTFSESVQGFALGDTTVTGGVLGNLVHTGILAGQDIYTATFTPNADNTEVGSVQVNASSYSDAAGNAGAASNSLGFSGDTLAPAVTSIILAGSSPNNAGSDSFTVTFSESVTGVVAADFALTTTNTPGGTALTDTGISSITGSGTTYTVTIGGVAGDGTLRLDLKSNDSGITDAAGNGAVAAFTGGDIYTIQHTPPSVASINLAAANPTNAGSEAFTVTFSESVTGVDSSDFTAITSGTADTGITVTADSGSVYTVTVNGVTGNGTLGLNLNSSGTGIADPVGNAISGGFTGQVYTVDHVAPTVASINLAGSNPNNASSEAFTVTFSKSVTGVDAGDFTAVTNGTADTGITVTPVSGSVYTVTVNGVTGDGTLGLNLKSTGTGIADLVGNAISAGFTGGVYTVDHSGPIAPSVTAVTDNGHTDIGAGHVITITLNTNESVTVVGTPTLALNDLGSASYIGGSGTSALTFSYTVPGGDNVTDLLVTGYSGSIHDQAGNALAPVTGDLGIQIDTTAPTVSISADHTAMLAGQTAAMTFTFSEAIQSFVLGDTTVTGGALSNLVHVGLNAGQDIYTATFTPAASDAEVGSVQVTGLSYSDNAGNAGAASNIVNFTGDTLAPAAPTLALTNDTGASNTDHVTKDPSITYSTPGVGDHFLYNLDGTVSATQPDFVAHPLADGAHTVAVQEVDTAGNVGATTTLAFTLDTTAPDSPTISASPGSGSVFAGSTVEFVLAFNHEAAVAVDTTGGTPTLSLDDGATARYNAAATAALHDPTKLAFDYLVSSSDPMRSSLAVTGYNSNGATITDLAGNSSTALHNVAATFPLQINENLVPALPLGGGVTRPALALDAAGEIVLDATSAAFVSTYGTKLLYAGLPASTPVPPVDPHYDFHLF